MSAPPPPFVVAPKCWYGWQIISAGTGERCVPWASPVYVTKVTPQKQGKGELHLAVECPMAIAGDPLFQEMACRVLLRTENYLVAQLLENLPLHAARCVVISHIEFAWVRQFCPSLYYQRPPTDFSYLEQGSISYYLEAVFHPAAHRLQTGS